MTATLVDTNVLLDLVTDDPKWADWSLQQLDAAFMRGKLLIDDVIYAELSVRFAKIEDLDDFISDVELMHAPTPKPALFLAAKVFQKYRAAGGARSSTLPDFFIGAHAAVEGHDLLTRDAKRYRSCFPKLVIVSP